MHLHGPTARQRQRAHAVLLSARGYKLDQLADILRADRDTISGWLDARQEQGMSPRLEEPSC
jgi:transposase